MGNLWTRMVERLTATEPDSSLETKSQTTTAKQTSVPLNKISAQSRFDLLLEHIAENNKLVEKYRKKYVADIANVIKKHYQPLKAKYDQLVYTDDYGYVILDDFMPEFDYFVMHVLLKEAPPFYADNSMAVDPTLWLSYESLTQEYGKLSDKRKKEVDSKTGCGWSPWSFFSFNVQLKNVNKINDLKSEETSMHANVQFVCRIVEDSVSEKEGIAYFYDSREVLLYVCKRVRTVAFSIFDYIRTLEESVKQEILKIPGVHKQQDAPANPLEYEKYIAGLLKDLGFNARTTKASGDQGADVIAKKNGISFAVQCKKYSQPVGNKAVQEANAGRDFYKCDYGVVVSNAGFTKSAKQAANACKIILLNDSQLERLLKYIQTANKQ